MEFQVRKGLETVGRLNIRKINPANGFFIAFIICNLCVGLLFCVPFSWRISFVECLPCIFPIRCYSRELFLSK